MANVIKTVTDKKNIETIFNRLFANKDVFLKTQNGNIKIVFQGFSENLVAFRIPFLKNMPAECLVFTRQNGVTVYAQLRQIEKEEDEVYVFEPIRMQVISAQRQEDRKNIASGEGAKDVISVTHIISDPIIHNSLVLNNRRIERIKNEALSEVEQLFTRTKIFLCHEGTTDPRMKYFYRENKPFFISDFNGTPEEKYADQFKEFIKEIYSKDYALINRKNLISEVSVPISYMQDIPYGYIQVNNESALNESSLIMIQKLADVVDSSMKREKIFLASDERLLVSDLSKSGLGLVFRDRKYIRYFAEKGYVDFNLMITQSLKMQVLCVVRNISFLENKIIKIGCEIVRMADDDRVKYNEYLDKIK